MEKHFKHDRSLIIIKPDGVQRSLVGEIIQRFERVGLKIVAMKMLVATEAQAEKHYAMHPGWKEDVGKKSIEGYKKKGSKPPSEDPLEVADVVLGRLKKYMSSSPVIVMVLQGAHAVELVRKIVGGTEPLSSDVGTIRGDYVMDSYPMADTDGRSVRNLVHASGSNEEAEREIKHWFDEEEILNYNHLQEKILYDVDWDGLLE